MTVRIEWHRKNHYNMLPIKTTTFSFSLTKFNKKKHRLGTVCTFVINICIIKNVVFFLFEYPPTLIPKIKLKVRHGVHYTRLTCNPKNDF